MHQNAKNMEYDTNTYFKNGDKTKATPERHSNKSAESVKSLNTAKVVEKFIISWSILI